MIECCPIDLFFLILYGALSGGVNIMVHQDPQALEVAVGSKVSITCKVTMDVWWERLWIEWKKDNASLCQQQPIGRNSSKITQGPRGCSLWIPEDTFILQLDIVNTTDHGQYACHVTLDIPVFKKAQGNGTVLKVLDSLKSGGINNLPGIFLWLLVATVVVGFGAVLGRVIYQFLSRSTDPGNHVYGNVLYYHQKAKEARPDNGKTLVCPSERKTKESIYSTGFPNTLAP